MVLFSRWTRKVCAALAIWCVTAQATATMEILATTQALSLVTQEVTGTYAEPLVPATVPLHDFSLKPSHIRRLQAAEFVVWHGPKVEPYLTKIMARIDSDKQLIVGEDHPAVADGHPWTSPDYLTLAMTQLSQRIQVPWNSETWRNEMALLQEAIQKKQQKLAKGNQGYVVFHDGIGGFESYFGIDHISSFTDSDDQPPGAKRMAMIASLSKSKQIACVLVDHEANTRLIDAVIDQAVQRQSIDILGWKSNSLVQYVTHLQQAFIGCTTP